MFWVFSILQGVHWQLYQLGVHNIPQTPWCCQGVYWSITMVAGQGEDLWMSSAEGSTLKINYGPRIKRRHRILIALLEKLQYVYEANYILWFWIKNMAPRPLLTKSPKHNKTARGFMLMNFWVILSIWMVSSNNIDELQAHSQHTPWHKYNITISYLSHCCACMVVLWS